AGLDLRGRPTAQADEQARRSRRPIHPRPEEPGETLGGTAPLVTGTASGQVGGEPLRLGRGDLAIEMGVKEESRLSTVHGCRRTKPLLPPRNSVLWGSSPTGAPRPWTLDRSPPQAAGFLGRVRILVGSAPRMYPWCRAYLR